MLLQTNPKGEVLYAIASQGYVARTRTWVVLPVTHLHAPSEHVARFRFLASVENRHRVQIIACAPAVGAFANEHGEKASA